jgi:uracil phosphoribosyltransferase
MDTEQPDFVDHPIALHGLTIMRDKSSTLAQFREACGQVVPCLIYRATAGLETKEKEIVTPLRETTGCELKNEVVFVAILRAGLAMLETALKIIPSARVGYFGLQRDEETAAPTSYYKKLPPLEHADVILLDPMLATGGSADYAIKEIKEHSPKSLSFCCIVAAEEGVKKLRKAHKEVPIYTVAMDGKLNEKNFIVPGLGDFGDRYHGTDY